MSDNAPRNETQLAYHRRRAEELRGLRTPWEAQWSELARFIEPSRLRLNLKDEGAVNRSAIIDETGTFSWRILQSGMHSGITSPARPWFRLGTLDPDLREYAPVKVYLSTTERLMREAFQASNIYNSFHTGYGDQGLFGQSLGILSGSDSKSIRLHQLMHGTFWLARDGEGRVTTMYRRFRWSVERIVRRFGLERVSQQVRTAYDSGRYDDRFDIWHAIEPRLNRDPRRLDKANKPFLSNYWEDSSREGAALLEESGFDRNPLIGPAWELAPDDHYATSPGMIALSSVKMLQTEQKRKLEGIDKKVRPPMTGPTSMRNNPASLLPGAITYVDTVQGGATFRPAMEVTLQLGELREDIRDVQERVRQSFYADLFLMLSQMEGVQPRNQFEIAERKEEKLLALGPVLENIYNGQLEPVIDAAYQTLNEEGRLPPPPPELQGQELKIEYISMLAQAQRAVATGSIERGLTFAGQLAAVKPDVLDKIDADQAVDEYFDMLGVPPAIVVPDEDVAKIRAARAEKQRAAENAEMAATVAPAAKAGAEAASVLAGASDNPAGAALLQQLGIAG